MTRQAISLLEKIICIIYALWQPTKYRKINSIFLLESTDTLVVKFVRRQPKMSIIVFIKVIAL
jgi:hypothetical protein